MLDRTSVLTLITLGIAAIGMPIGANAQTTWHVDDDAPNDPGPGDPLISDPLEDGSADHPFDAIQEGIDVAVDGDTVLVLDGTYTGVGNKNLDFGGRLITLCSASNDPTQCIIDCEDDGRGFHFHSGETHSAVVRGFKITRGLEADGGGVFCESHSAPTISRCVVIENEVVNYGGGVYCLESSPIITNCRIARNRAGAGGGICCHEGSDPAIINCLIEANATMDAQYVGGGLRCNWGSSPTVTNCTIVENASRLGAGSGIGCLNDSTPTITNCILWGNRTTQIYDGGGGIAVTYCDVQGGWPGIGNIDSDPLLTADGFHLRASSPCRDAGDPNGTYAGQSDADGELRESDDRVDMGVDEYLDADEDALPDWWESLYFASPTGGDPTVDHDDDGRTTAQEYVLGTNPVLPPLTYYASVGGDDSWDGLAPQWDGEHGPKATIQAALDATHPLEGDTVVVADGTYVGDGNRELDFQGKAILLCSENGPDNCIIDCEASGRSFDFHSHENATSVLQGFTVCNGSAWQGGGIYCGYNSSPTIINCVLTENASMGSGGGICCWYSTATLLNCRIASNTAVQGGGGIRCSESGLTITGCEISDNTCSNSGGGIRVSAWSNSVCLTISDCSITGNQAGSDGGGLGGAAPLADLIVQNSIIADNSAGGKGGGLDLDASIAVVSDCAIARNEARDGGGVEGRSHALLLVNCNISDNVALEQGGGIDCVFTDDYYIIACDVIGNRASGNGGGVCCEDNMYIAGCTIAGNMTYSEGGGVFCNGGTPTAVNCTIVSNDSPGAYAIHCAGSELQLTNCLVSQNTCEGAIYCYGRSYGSCDVRVSNCTIADNTGSCGAITCDSDLHMYPNEIVVVNSVIWSDGPTAVNDDGSSITVSYSDCEDGWSGAGNISTDPLFLDPDGPDGDPNTWEDNDYRLSPGSPCIDAGDNTAVPLDIADLDGDGDTDERTPFDLDGNPRFVQDPFTEDTGVPDPPRYRHVVDMGAYEFQFCFGDLDDDDDIDLADLAQLLGSYGETTGMTYYDGDLDGDGDVDLADLAELLGAYGESCH